MSCSKISCSSGHPKSRARALQLDLGGLGVATEKPHGSGEARGSISLRTRPRLQGNGAPG